ncbi:MAG: valine--tRNA ligase [Chlamydiae bacterium]|nr:valine--tRNA ligase [Chlamydiota bacterium]
MSSDLPTTYDPSIVEDKWYSFWETTGLFRADALSKKRPYCIVLPPPNVTGSLHMGHALVDTVQDTLIRFKKMEGFETLWLPGVDHAGIATQTIVERHLIATQGKRRKDFSREDFLSHVWAWKEANESSIIKQLKKLGCSCDWSRKRFTMDDVSNRAVRTLFKKMFDQGLIYRGNYLVNWDPVTQTALADDEVEHEERESFLWHIRYPLEDGTQEVIIATTRPETLLGDIAVAVSPSDPRYQGLLGKNLLLPLVGRKLPVIADHYVDPSFGTGAVKITPAHDFNDYEIGRRHNLALINIMTPDGYINENGGEFQGLSMQECREKILLRLQEKGFLVKKEPHTHKVGVSYRSKATIEPYLSKQWFIKMGSFKEKLLDVVKTKKIKMIPEYWESTYYHWIENLRDWCISRQLWWGHRIPIWYHKEDPDKILCYDGEGLPPEVQKNPTLWHQDEDVLDTWFSSALWPFSTLGWPDTTDDLKKFYPTSVLVTGHDILFFWVARMILMGEFAMGDIPFHETFLHGLIYGKSYWRLDPQGGAVYLPQQERLQYDLGKEPPKEVFSKWEKMSKTKGNVIDPLEIIDAYGADAMRMALLSSLTHARQIDLDRRRFEEFKNFSNKLWNSARFVFLNLEASSQLASLTPESFSSGLDPKTLLLEDLWILQTLSKTTNEGRQHLAAYEFDKAAQVFYSFFWDKFCAYYVEIAKPTLFGKSGTPALRENKQKILTLVLLASLRLMHPMVPFITEELFQRLKTRFPSVTTSPSLDPYTKEALLSLQKPSCMLAPYPHAHTLPAHSMNVQEDFNYMNALVYHIRNLRGEMQLPPSVACDVYFIGDDLARIKKYESIISALVRVRSLYYEKSCPEHLAFSATLHYDNLQMVIPLPEEFKEKEKQRLLTQKDKLSLQVNDLEAKLSNEAFTSKAPQALVESSKKSLDDLRAKLSDIEIKLQKL